MKRLALIGVLLIISVVLISGCTQTDTGTGQITREVAEKQEVSVPTVSKVPDPENIELFGGVKEGSIMRFYFTFNDKIGHDGAVELKITDSAEKTVYSKKFDVKSEQFIDYEVQLTGKPVGKAYEWKVPLSDIKKGMSPVGNAYLKFKTLSGKTLTADAPLFDIPAYTEEEIKQLYEEGYLKSAKTLGKSITKGNFQVILSRYGYFKHSVFGKEVTSFRVDIEVKNVGMEQDAFFIHDGALIVGNEQYNVGFDSEFDGMNIYPNIVKKGYLVFEDVPDGLSGEARVIVGHFWVDFNTVNYEFTIEI